MISREDYTRAIGYFQCAKWCDEAKIGIMPHQISIIVTNDTLLNSDEDTEELMSLARDSGYSVKLNQTSNKDYDLIFSHKGLDESLQEVA